MLHRNPSEATGYWLQLVVAVGIATLGLVLGSTAVVIGAMLISPLMAPIVSFGMGLAVGSPFLVLRAWGRIALSVVTVVGLSATLVAALPFHELNAEIAARTTPTVLDLLTAAFCALAGVYAAMRPPSDVAATAAGTSIGISLVPPLCASGFGVGTANWSVAGGAALLFVTNLAAIIVVGTLAFLAAGFNQVSVAALEREELGSGTDAPVARYLARAFSSRGAWLRFVMPFLMLAAVYVPLRKGLDEVAWQIRIRQAVQAALADVPSRIVHSKVFVERGQVEVALVILGGTGDADAARALLEGKLTMAGVEPRLEVTAVPDAAGLEAALVRQPSPVIPTPKKEVSVFGAFASTRDEIFGRWPTRATGRPLAISVRTGKLEDQLEVTVWHWGSPVGDAAREVIERSLKDGLNAKLVLEERALSGEPFVPGKDPSGFIVKLARAIEAANAVDGVVLCITRPDRALEKEKAGDQALLNVIRGLTAGEPKAFSSDAIEVRAWLHQTKCEWDEPGQDVKP
jgi:uncharacterized hydrophobic protein (TIGR00271 family)